MDNDEFSVEIPVETKHSIKITRDQQVILAICLLGIIYVVKKVIRSKTVEEHIV